MEIVVAPKAAKIAAASLAIMMVATGSNKSAAEKKSNDPGVSLSMLGIPMAVVCRFMSTKRSSFGTAGPGRFCCSCALLLIILPPKQLTTTTIGSCCSCCNSSSSAAGYYSLGTGRDSRFCSIEWWFDLWWADAVAGIASR